VIRTTVICHFWNNAAVLPYWLRHHTRIFDHGIMIDHGATDESAALIRELAPHWELRQTERCREAFDAAEADKEVMEIEEQVRGWKMALNVTEFLLHFDLHEYIAALPRGVRGVTTSGVVLVDSEQTRNIPLTDEPLFFQRTHGYFEYELGKRPEDYGYPAVWRSRLLHNYPNGQYETGRHVTHVPHTEDPRLFLVWTGWAPFELLKKMKLEVQTRIPASDFERGLSLQHKLDSEAELEARLAEHQQRSHDLLIDPDYISMLERTRRFLYAPGARRRSPVVSELRGRLRRLAAGMSSRA
jgi:hypothetical protein